MPDFVRVRDKSTGHHYSVMASEAESNPDAYQVLKQDAVDTNGDPLPGEVPESSGQSATTTKKES